MADEYSKLKLRLKEQYPYDRDGYTVGKENFIHKYTELARAEFPLKYNPTV